MAAGSSRDLNRAAYRGPARAAASAPAHSVVRVAPGSTTTTGMPNGASSTGSAAGGACGAAPLAATTPENGHRRPGGGRADLVQAAGVRRGATPGPCPPRRGLPNV